MPTGQVEEKKKELSFVSKYKAWAKVCDEHWRILLKIPRLQGRNGQRLIELMKDDGEYQPAFVLKPKPVSGNETHFQPFKVYKEKKVVINVYHGFKGFVAVAVPLNQEDAVEERERKANASVQLFES